MKDLLDVRDAAVIFESMRVIERVLGGADAVDALKEAPKNLRHEVDSLLAKVRKGDTDACFKIGSAAIVMRDIVMNTELGERGGVVK